MTVRHAAFAAAALAALGGCGAEEESVSDRFNRLTAEVENKAGSYEAQAENMVSQEERLREAEADAFQNQARNDLANAAEAANSILGSGNGQ